MHNFVRYGVYAWYTEVVNMQREHMSSPFLVRKVFHAVVVVVAAYLAVSFGGHAALAYSLIALALFLGARNIGWFAHIRSSLTANYGDIFLGIGLVLSTFIILPLSSEAYIAGLFVAGFADPLAALVGIAWGKTRYRLFGEERSLVGSGAFFIAAVLICFVLTANSFLALGVAILATFVEALAIRGTDNMFLPLVVGLCLALV